MYRMNDLLEMKKRSNTTLTPAPAHFEPLHSGFNMMSLVSPGEALEEWGHGSWPESEDKNDFPHKNRTNIHM